MQHDWNKILNLIKDGCTNYSGGNCAPLDCPCVQMNSRETFQNDGKLLCNYFVRSVLPTDQELEARTTRRFDDLKQCASCGVQFAPSSNRAKYCSKCAKKIRNARQAKLMRERRAGLNKKNVSF